MRDIWKKYITNIKKINKKVASNLFYGRFDSIDWQFLVSTTFVWNYLWNLKCLAAWPSGKAWVCKTFILGSIPSAASIKTLCAVVAKLVDAKDLKSFGLYACAGSSPALGTIFSHLNIMEKIWICFISWIINQQYLI